MSLSWQNSNHNFILFSTWWLIIIITSTSDLQPSTAIAVQLPGQLVSSQIRTMGVKKILIHYSIDSVQDIDCDKSVLNVRKLN